MAYGYSLFMPVPGAELFTIVVLPEKEGKFPAVLRRSPYVDALEDTPPEQMIAEMLEGEKPLLSRGFAVVVQHCRGRGKSTGDCIPYINERADGLALQAWVREQPFYSGELYLHGGSYTTTVHYATAPFAPDIRGAVFEVQDTERYNCVYRNGCYKAGLHGGWYAGMYKHKTMPEKPYDGKSFLTLPLKDFSQRVFGEQADIFNAELSHPDHSDPFWQTHEGGIETRDAVRDAGIPILLITGMYDIYTGGIFAMWNAMTPESRAKCAIAVHPYPHSGQPDGQPVTFPDGCLRLSCPDYAARWMGYVRGLEEPPFTPGKMTYYRLFENTWRTDDFTEGEKRVELPLGEGERTYRYDPRDPATFKGGLSCNFGGTAWQDPAGLRQDIITVYTEPFAEDTFVRGKMEASLSVRSDREDTAFYMRLSLEKAEGSFGLRDDITPLSRFAPDYVPGQTVRIEFRFDEHAFRIAKGERLRIDISSSAYPMYVPHTNRRGLFSEQDGADTANNTLILTDSVLMLPTE